MPKGMEWGIWKASQLYSLLQKHNVEREEERRKISLIFFNLKLHVLANIF